MDDQQVILAFVTNLMFSTRIESIVEKKGFVYREISSINELFGEDTGGTEEAFLNRITRVGPSLIIFDLGINDIPWEQWLLWLKAPSISRQIPVICFGSHVDVDTLKSARQAGAEAVMARSRFVTALPALIEKYVR